MRYAVLLAFLAVTTPAWADDAALQAQVFGHAIGAEPGFACFSRTYDAAHLASHPHQNVTAALLLLKGMPKEEDQFTVYTAGVDFTYRKRKTHFQSFGNCPSISKNEDGGAAQTLACGIDCDGGVIQVKLKDTDTVLVELPGGISGSDTTNKDGPPIEGHFGSDDKLFKLSRVDVKSCLPLALDEDKAAIKKQK